MTTPQAWFLCASIIFLVGVLLWAVIITVVYNGAERIRAPRVNTQNDGKVKS